MSWTRLWIGCLIVIASACGGAPACPEATDDPSIDIDSNGVADCEESLVRNGQLQGSAAPWEASDSDTTVEYVEPGASGEEGDGAIRVTSSAESTSPSFRFAQQCVPIEAEERYLLGGSYFIATGQDVPGLGAQLQLQLYGEPDCAGDPGSPQVTDIVMEQGRWLTLTREVTAPRAQSALIRATVRKNAGNTVGEILFDNLMVSPR